MQGIDPFQGIDPSSYEFHKFSNVEMDQIISECIICEKSHGWCVQDMNTGKLTPMDICEPCLLKVENGTSTASRRAEPPTA